VFLFYILFRVDDQDCIKEIHMYFGLNNDEMSSRRDRFKSSARSDNIAVRSLAYVDVP